MGLFRKHKEPIIEVRNNAEPDDVLLKALLSDEVLTREVAMSIPAVAACVNRIADTVASLDVKLYVRSEESIDEVKDDIRVKRLNGDTGDTLNGYQLKRAMVSDFLLGKGGYAFIHKHMGEVVGLHYIPCEDICIHHNTDKIYKTYQIYVDGLRYEPHQFIKLLRNTRNGFYGVSILEDSPKLFGIVSSTQDLEKSLARRGGAKKGYLQSESRLDDKTIETLRNSYARMYGTGDENIIVLNEGIKFQEASATSVELQMNENKETNNNDICKIFGIPPAIINGGGNSEDKRLYYEGCIYPILTEFTRALNDSLLNPYLNEDNMFFAFDDSMLTRADIKTRYEAYEKGLKNGFLQLDEIRQKENLPTLGLDFVKLGLQDVLVYPDTGDIYTPNMGVFANLKDKTVTDVKQKTEEGDIDEGRDKK